MQRFLALFIATSFLLGGCGTTPTDAESTREIVLQYLGSDVGTAGPFGKGGKKELYVLSDTDRRAAEALIDRGAAAFLVFGGAGSSANGQPHVTRIVLVQSGRIVGDYGAMPNAPAEPPATPAPAR